MKPEIRMDRMSFGKPERLPNGHLRVPITATRVGIFVYRRDDGSEWREFRPPEEVFNADSMATLRSVPATNNHPNENDGLLTSENTTKFMVGYTSDDVKRVDDLLATSMTIVEANTINEVDSGDKREVSCGYTCQLEMKPGTYRGQRYDAIQRKIRYNHVAICKNARGGSDVRIHLDSKQQVLRLDSVLGPEELNHDVGESMEKILVIEGVEFKVSADAHAAITNKFNKDSNTLKEVKDKLQGVEDEKQKVQARHDSLETENKKLKETAAGAAGVRKDSKEFQEAVSARVALERFAATRLDDDLTALSDRQIIVELIKLDSPDFKEEGKTDVYLQSRLDHMMETADDEDDDGGARTDADDDDDGNDQQQNRGRNAYNQIKNGARTDSKNSNKGRAKTHDEIRADSMESQQNRWQKPIGATRKRG